MSKATEESSDLKKVMDAIDAMRIDMNDKFERNSSELKEEIKQNNDNLPIKVEQSNFSLRKEVRQSNANLQNLKEELQQSVEGLTIKIDKSNKSLARELSDKLDKKLTESITKLDENINVMFNKHSKDVQKNIEELAKSVGTSLRRQDERVTKFSEQVDNKFKNIGSNLGEIKPN